MMGGGGITSVRSHLPHHLESLGFDYEEIILILLFKCFINRKEREVPP